jgi:hypothetical protein
VGGALGVVAVAGVLPGKAERGGPGVVATMLGGNDAITIDPDTGALHESTHGQWLGPPQNTRIGPDRHAAAVPGHETA